MHKASFVAAAAKPTDLVANLTDGTDPSIRSFLTAYTADSIPGQGHATSARDSAGPTLEWIAARFAGNPPPSDCGRI